MADNLEPVGAELVLKGLQDFTAGITTAIAGMTSLQRVLTDLATTSASAGAATEQGSRRIVSATDDIISASNKLATSLEANMQRGAAAVSKFMFTEGGGKEILDIFKQLGMAADVLTAKELEDADKQIAAEQKLLRTFQERRSVEATKAVVGAQQEQLDYLDKYSQKTEQASGGSLNFVRSITALVSASNLLGISGNNAALNIATMAASFDRGGAAGIAMGGAIGAVLAVIGSLISAYQLIKTTAENAVGAVVSLTEALVQQAATGFTQAVKAAADYQQQLAFTVGLLQPTRERMEELNTKIEETSRTTIFGMGKAAEAVNELARAGVSLTDIVTNGALDAVVALSTAANGELNLGDAAKAVTGIVGSYKQVINGALTETVSFKEATDALTGTAQLSRLSFNEVIAAWRQAGPIAASTKISVSDLGAVIAILANAGESASISGTSLKQVILDLEKPSKAATDELNKFHVSLFTADGQIRPFRDVIIDMNRAFGEQALKEGKVTEEEQKHALAVIFGARAAIAANIITNQGAEAFDKMKKSMAEVKTEDLANTLVLPLNARLTILKNNVETLAIAFAGPVVSAFSDAVNAALAFAQSIPIDDVKAFGQAVVSVVTGQGLGQLKDKLQELASPQQFAVFNSLIDFASKVRDAFVNQIIPAVDQVVTRFVNWATSQSTIDGFIDKVNKAGNVVTFVAEVVSEGIGAFADWVDQLSKNEEALNRVKNVVEGLATVIIGSLVASFVVLAPPVLAVLDILEQIGKLVDPSIQHIANLATGVDQAAGSIDQSASSIVDSSEAIPAATIEATDTTISALDVMQRVYGNAAKNIIGIQDAEANALIANSEEIVQTHKEQWDNISDITGQGVSHTAMSILALEPVMTQLENAPKQAVGFWATAWAGLLEIVDKAIKGIIETVDGIAQSVSDNPILQMLFGVSKITPIGPLGPIPAIINDLKVMGDVVGGVHKAWDDLNARLDNIGHVIIPGITSVTRDQSGVLKTLLDNLNSALDSAKAKLDALRAGAGGKNTEGADYPVKPPPGGGGGRTTAGPEVAFNRALDQAEEFGNDMSDKIQKAGQQAIEKLEDIWRKAEDATIIAIREYNEKSDALTKKAAQEQSTAIDNLTQQRHDRELTQNLDHLLKLEAQNRQFAITDRNNRISDERETQDRVQAVIDRALSHGFELQQRQRAQQRSRQQEDENTAYKRSEDDEEHHLQRLEDLRNKPTHRQTAEEIRQIQSAGGFSKAVDSEETLYQRRLQRQRGREDKDTKRQRDIEDSNTQFAEGQYIEQINFQDDMDARHYRTTLQRRTEDRTRQRQDTLDDAAFDQHQQEVRQSLQDNIEVAGLNRRLALIEQNRKDQQDILDRELGETRQKILAAAEEQSRSVLGSLGNTLQDVQRMIADKAPEIVKAGGDAMQPVIDAIVANLQTQMDIVYEAAHTARLELEAVARSNIATIPQPGVPPAQAPAPTTPPASTPQSPYYNAQPNLEPVPSSINNSPYSTGQVGAQALPATQLVAPAGVGVTTVNNVTNVNVDANYVESQSPVTLRQDLAAFAMLGRR